MDLIPAVGILDGVAIASFARREISEFFATGVVDKREGWSASASVAARKLDMIEYAAELADLRSPPGEPARGTEGTLARLLQHSYQRPVARRISVVRSRRRAGRRG